MLSPARATKGTRLTRVLRTTVGAVVCLLIASAGPPRAHASEAPVGVGGQLSARLSGEATRVPVPLERTVVDIEISGSVARTTVRQTFSNPFEAPIEAVYAFPLPDESAVGAMSMTIGERTIRAKIAKRASAKKRYERAKSEGRAAALLEQERPNIFTQSVANIRPGHPIVVELVYDEVLKYEGGEYELVFPMVVGPRYVPGAQKPPGPDSGGGFAPDTAAVPDGSRITPPVLRPGERSGHDIQLSVELHPGVPVRGIEVPSHQVVYRPDDAAKRGRYDGTISIALAPNDTIPNKDFVLRWTVAGDAPETALLQHRGALGNFFMLMFQPPEAPREALITPKEVVFVVDTSGSMNGLPTEAVKRAMRHALERLNPRDTFRILRFSEDYSALSDEPLTASPAHVAKGMRFVEQLRGSGGTEMLRGIRRALTWPEERGRLRVIVFMTDGFIGNERQVLEAIDDDLGRSTRLFAFGVGSSPNRYLLNRMAERGRGSSFYIDHDTPPEPQVEAFYERIKSPVLTHVEVDWGALKVGDTQPAAIPDLFAGQPLVVTGRFEEAGSSTVKVHGQVGGEPVVYELEVEFEEVTDDNPALAQLWARDRIKALMRERQVDEREVTALGLEYGLVTKYTSFVAVDDAVTVNPEAATKTVQVPVELPEGARYEGFFDFEGDEIDGEILRPDSGSVELERRELRPPAPSVEEAGGAMAMDVALADSGSFGRFTFYLSAGPSNQQEGGGYGAAVSLDLGYNFMLVPELEIGPHLVAVVPFPVEEGMTNLLAEVIWHPTRGLFLAVAGGLSLGFYADGVDYGPGYAFSVGFDLGVAEGIALSPQLRYDGGFHDGEPEEADGPIHHLSLGFKLSFY